MTQHWDLLIRNATFFDGSGQAGYITDLAISAGAVAAIGPSLDSHTAHREIDAKGLWLMPGLLDIHTHYDLEVELSSGLPESVRHGTTTVVVANCSLGLAFGAQRRDGKDPIVDCFARVENIPKPVLSACADKATWHTPREYLAHLDTLALGPNIVPLLPHSMLRIEVMGFDASVERDANAEELATMQSILADALDAGFVGLSTDGLPFHYLANQPNTHKTIPTQFAPYSELKALTHVVREKNGVWQATPPKDSPIDTIKNFLLTSGKLHGKPLTTTVVAALDVHANRNIVKLAKTLAWAFNSTLLAGDFHLQALAAPFKVWADGPITPLAEEIPELRRLNEPDLEARAERLAILNDDAFIRRFKTMWLKGKSGVNLARLKRLLRLEDYAFNRCLADMTIDRCPIPQWQGKNLQQIFDLVVLVNNGTLDYLNEDASLALIRKAFAQVRDEADFILQILRSFDTDLSWYTVSANRNIDTVRALIMHPKLLPGFNDCGAHLNNMAFYDGNLRALQLAALGGEQDLAYMVKRLTRDPAKVFKVNAGTLNVGDRADCILIDPEQLLAYNSDANTQRIYRPAFQHEQLVNRSDGVVSHVIIAGKIIREDNKFCETFEQERFGSTLLKQ
ncbi:amidohydrolase family protein [Simiduia litorea]|uniref:N-acyl-D-amino-acid deacylase family protein n=1 Tax=Simiduia litorea TaxID=1435348 RepID=UPI0036F432F8